VRAAVVNSGNANAATGERGYRDALAMRDAAASALGLQGRAVAIAETGTIGVPLPVDDVVAGVERAAGELSDSGGDDFAEAIMTTDRSPKRCTVSAEGVTLSAQAKGAGMIEPGFATMLCFCQTDAVVEDAEEALRSAVWGSFERITVDGQMSTNDTVLLQASGASGRSLPDGLLEAVLTQLALEIVADGEGATRVGRVEASGAATEEEAERVARAIANSPLVKTAFYGRDPNWGRIAMAVGKIDDPDIHQDSTTIRFGAMEVYPKALDEGDLDALAAIMRSEHVLVHVTLGDGPGRSTVYGCDLSREYIAINADYTT
jgi:glutamate N-acetyltransferase/amino-acid N-acetyltransferase